MINFIKNSKFYSREYIIPIITIILCLGVLLFVYFEISYSRDPQNKKQWKHNNEVAAQVWCDNLKVNCAAINCEGRQEAADCTINYNNNIIVLSCYSSSTCDVKKLSH